MFCVFSKKTITFSFLQIWVMAFCVTFVFTVTLSVFPAVTADVRTIFSQKWGNTFPPFNDQNRSLLHLTHNRLYTHTQTLLLLCKLSMPLYVLLRAFLYLSVLLLDFQHQRLARTDHHHIDTLGECLVASCLHMIAMFLLHSLCYHWMIC